MASKGATYKILDNKRRGFDSEKVERVRAQIKKGTYDLSGEKLASAIMAAVHPLEFKRVKEKYSI